MVSTCLAGAFIGSLFSGWIADGVGRRRAFQLCALPMIIGAIVRLYIYQDLIHIAPFGNLTFGVLLYCEVIYGYFYNIRLVVNICIL